MTREEAARVLKYLWIERDENAKSMQQLTKSFFERQEALRVGAAILRKPKPDSVTITLPNNGMCAIVRKVDGHYEIDTGRVEKWPEAEE